jgi:hypothetical protein
MELVDMLVLGTSAEMRVGSSPTEGNTHIKICTSPPCFVIKTSFLLAKEPIKKLCFFINKPKVKQNKVLSNKDKVVRRVKKIKIFYDIDLQK